MSMARSDIYPTVYSVFQHFLSSITHLWKELSFSMRKKFLAEERNFTVENVLHYMILPHNSCIMVNDIRVECCVLRLFLIFIRFNLGFNTEI